MLNWSVAKDDPYYLARQLEEKARRTGNPDAWREFASLKASKGSYILACHGFFSGALAYEQSGDIERALKMYTEAFNNARRARSRELAVMVAYRQALVAEQVERLDVCIQIYEELGAFAEELGNHFIAADAYEHAAEMRAKTGQPVLDYRSPIEQWEKNAAFWRTQGHEDDAAWSERHIRLYKTVFGIEEK